MKQSFIDKKFTPESRALLTRILTILERYSAQGYDLSLRQLYYQLVAANVIENSERSYKNIGSLVSDARLAGLIDWDMIKDRGREMLKEPHWINPRQFMASVVPQFAIDKWLDQPSYVEVMVEKQALEGVLHPVCANLDVPFTSNKGYSSSSALYEAGRRIYKRLCDEKRVHIIYLGDHDPSGIDMTRDVLERLRQFAESYEQDGIGITMHRVALNMSQVEELRPPKNPAKLTDSRANDYISRFGRNSWELDAIEPSALAKLVREKVKELRDERLWEKTVKVEAKMRKELEAFSKLSKFD